MDNDTGRGALVHERAAPDDDATDSAHSPVAHPRARPGVITVAIVEDRSVARIGLQQVVGSFRGVEIIAALDTMAALDPLTADVVVAGVPALDDGDPILALGVHGHRGAVLAVCAGRIPSRMLITAIRVGVRGVVGSAVQPDELLLAIRALASGGIFIAAQFAPALRGAPCRPEHAQLPALTPREVETVTWLAEGLTHRQIARQMGLSEMTVNTYVKRLRDKLNASNQAELTRKVIESGYLTTDVHLS
jgi:DNA-binding NarL/FixJ family response regulator